MAYNNPGYPPYQYQDGHGWPANYPRQQNQMPGQRQTPQQHQVLPSQQSHLQQRGYNPNPNPQQGFANQPSAVDMNQMQQQYQYRAMQRPDAQYAQRTPQYENSPVHYSPVSQTYSSPGHSYQAYTPQRQHNQFSNGQDQQLPAMPQRQLSYAQPQQYQVPSPQLSQGFIHPGPQMTMQNFQSPIQSSLNQQGLFRPSPDPQMIRSMQSQSPVNQAPTRVPSISAQHTPVRQLNSQSPIVPPHNLVTHSDQLVQQHYVPAVTTKPQEQSVSKVRVESTAMLIQSDSSIEPSPVRLQSTRIINNLEGSTDERTSISKSIVLPSKSADPHVPSQLKVERSQPLPQSKQKPTAVQPIVEQGQIKPVFQPQRPDSTSAKEKKAESRPGPYLEKESAQKIKIESKEQLSRPVAEIDYALLLIDLAEEYFDAAYGVEKDDQPAQPEKDIEVFYKLIATGLGCLEVVLKQWRSALQPAVEAAVRLRYASILYSETTNTSEAEEVLSKGISQCDKLRLMDFKYNMHHLLARVTFSTNPKAAVKYVGTVIKDAEVQGHIPWIYAFRFLSASLSLQMQSPQEALQALSQLKVVLSTAKSRGDIEVAATASAIEAMVHISRANNAEAIEQAQHALATVRSAQNNPNMSKIPQLIIMAYFVDLVCSLFKAESENAHKKMTAMHEAMDDLSQHSAWGIGNEILIPITKESAKALPGRTAYGVVISQKAEGAFLKMAWIPKDELYAIGNMLGAATLMHKASYVKKCEELLNNAQAFLKVAATNKSSIPQSKVHQDLTCQLDILKIFGCCKRNAWTNAKTELNSLKVKMAGMDDAAKVALPAYIIYLEAMIAQGTGDTATALVLYNNPMLVPATDNNSATRRPPVINDLATLATLNSILIVHQPKHPRHHEMDSLMDRLEGLDSTSASGNMRGAYYLVRALRSDASTDPTTNPILNTKNNLREVLQIARQTENSQFSCISLTFMTDRFFKGQMGEQAHKSASTALNLAKRARNDLWTSVAESLLADCLETRGDSAEAQNRRNDALQLAMRLPASMQIAADDVGDG